MWTVLGMRVPLNVLLPQGITICGIAETVQPITLARVLMVFIDGYNAEVQRVGPLRRVPILAIFDAEYPHSTDSTALAEVAAGLGLVLGEGQVNLYFT